MATYHEKRQEWVASWQPPEGKRRFYRSKIGPEDADAQRDQDKKAWSSGPTPSKELDLHTLAGLLWWPRVEHNRPNTVRRYRDAYKRHVKPEFGHLTPSEIKPSHVQRWVSEQVRNGASPSTVQLHKHILSAILAACMREGVAATNATTGTKMPTPKKRVRVCTPSAVRDLLTAVDGTELAAPVYLAAVLGMSRGEVCGLKWMTCDRSTRRVAIVGQRLVRQGEREGKKVMEGPTKRDSRTRSFVLPPSLWDALEMFGDLDSQYVAARRNHRPWNPEHLTEEWAKARDALGFRDWHFHDLRHAAAGVLAYLGVDLLTIAAILGHSKIDTTLLYASAQEETATKGFGLVGDALFPVEKRPPLLSETTQSDDFESDGGE